MDESTPISRLGGQLALDFWAAWFYEVPAEQDFDDSLAAHIGGGEL